MKSQRYFRRTSHMLGLPAMRRDDSIRSFVRRSNRRTFAVAMAAVVVTSFGAPAVPAMAAAPMAGENSNDVFAGTADWWNPVPAPAPRLVNSPRPAPGQVINVMIPALTAPSRFSLVSSETLHWYVQSGSAGNSCASEVDDAWGQGVSGVSQNVYDLRADPLAWDLWSEGNLNSNNPRSNTEARATQVSLPLSLSVQPGDKLCMYSEIVWATPYVDNGRVNFEKAWEIWGGDYFEYNQASGPLETALLSWEEVIVPQEATLPNSPVLSLAASNPYWNPRAIYAIGATISQPQPGEGPPIKREIQLSYTPDANTPCQAGQALRTFDLVNRGAGWDSVVYEPFEVLPNSQGRYLCARQYLLSGAANAWSAPTYQKIYSNPKQGSLAFIKTRVTAPSGADLQPVAYTPAKFQKAVVPVGQFSGSITGSPTGAPPKKATDKKLKPGKSNGIESRVRPLSPILVDAANTQPYAAIGGASDGFVELDKAVVGHSVAFAGSLSLGVGISGGERITDRAIHRGYAADATACLEKRLVQDQVTQAPRNADGSVFTGEFATTDGNGIIGLGSGQVLCAWQTLEVTRGTGANAVRASFVSIPSVMPLCSVRCRIGAVVKE